ncbi:MAG: hypothetical protein ABII00_03430 [Elusimicrobiota bacterium]
MRRTDLLSIPAGALALCLALPPGTTAQVKPVPVMNPGVGGSGASGAVSTEAPSGGGSGIELSAPTLTGTNLPSAASPAPVTRQPAARPAVGVRPASAPGDAAEADALKTPAATPGQAPAVGSKRTRQGLEGIRKKTGEVRRVLSGREDAEGRGRKASSINSSIFDGAGAAPDAERTPVPAVDAAVGGAARSGLRPAARTRSADEAFSGILVREAAHTGNMRRESWKLDGRPAAYLDGGGFKDVLVHPLSPDHLVTLFNQAGARDTIGSRVERDRELARRRRLADRGLAPRVVLRARLNEVRDDGSRVIAYFVQERVRGRTLSRIPPGELGHVRALFDSLVRARLKITDEVRLLDNIMIGRTVSDPRTRAYVIDAGEVDDVGARPLLDRWLGRPDPLAAHYDRLFEEIRAQVMKRPAAPERPQETASPSIAR